MVAHLRPGARVVACGLQWTSPWNLPGNLFVMGAAMYSVTTLAGLDAPWRLLARRLTHLRVESAWMGAVYFASGIVPAR